MTKRFVTREGVVGLAFAVNAPTYLELKSIRRHEGVQNFLYSDSPNLDLSFFRGKHVVVSGEEWVDDRWPRTPLLRVTKIEDGY